MKTIYLVRHAQAAGKDKGVADIERKLTKSGKTDAQKVAKKFSNKAKPKLIIASTAKRAVETANIFAKQLGYAKKKIETNEVIYKSGQQEFLGIVKGVDDKIKSLLLVGHSPSFDQFAGSLVRSFKRPLPICAIIGIKFDVDSWSKIVRGMGQLSYFDHPNLKKERQEKYKEFKKEVEFKLITSIAATLKRVDAASAEKSSKEIQKTSKSLVASFSKAVEKSNPSRIYDRRAAVRRPVRQPATKATTTQRAASGTRATQKSTPTKKTPEK